MGVRSRVGRDILSRFVSIGHPSRSHVDLVRLDPNRPQNTEVARQDVYNKPQIVLKNASKQRFPS